MREEKARGGGKIEEEEAVEVAEGDSEIEFARRRSWRDCADYMHLYVGVCMYSVYGLRIHVHVMFQDDEEDVLLTLCRNS